MPNSKSSEGASSHDFFDLFDKSNGIKISRMLSDIEACLYEDGGAYESRGEAGKESNRVDSHDQTDGLSRHRVLLQRQNFSTHSRPQVQTSEGCWGAARAAADNADGETGASDRSMLIDWQSNFPHFRSEFYQLFKDHLFARC